MKTLCKVVIIILVNKSLFAQNPIIRNQFTADPSACVFNNKVFVFPSHDIFAVEGKGRPGWFCMEDYHTFSSENLTKWIDHGVIVTQNKVEWVDSNSYSMWAPDCIERNGKYYFYFPAMKKVVGENDRKGFGIGVAVADKPEGYYVPQNEPIVNVNGIDPNVFIDTNGQAYLYWSMGNIYVAKLNENMLALDSEPQIITNLPQKGLKEGPYVFERKGIYYLSFPHVENKTECLEYAIGDNPMGPFTMMGRIMDESPMNCWTNHHSIIQFKQQWYLFYHQNALSPKFDKNRAICIDSLSFNTDGTIQKVIPTNRGVGLTNAYDQIQIDRYSTISDNGVFIEFNDTLNTFNGWKTIFKNGGASIQYNSVDFGSEKLEKVIVRAFSEKGNTIQIKLDDNKGAVIAEVSVPSTGNWVINEGKLLAKAKGIHNLIVLSKNMNPIEVDWVQFLH